MIGCIRVATPYGPAVGIPLSAPRRAEGFVTRLVGVRGTAAAWYGRTRIQ